MTSKTAPAVKTDERNSGTPVLHQPPFPRCQIMMEKDQLRGRGDL
jgi:hypothetical protein